MSGLKTTTSWGKFKGFSSIPGLLYYHLTVYQRKLAKLVCVGKICALLTGLKPYEVTFHSIYMHNRD